jgi:L-ascorbate metabolism protein UlaG (beta-lactamase superfamily)
MKYLTDKKLFKVIISISFIILFFNSCSIFSEMDLEENVSKNKKVNNYIDGEFVNKNPTEGVTESFLTVAYNFLFKNRGNRKPKFEIPIVKTNIDSFAIKNSDVLSVVWLGHATTLININGSLILTDPMLTNWASPIAWIGPKRFFDSPIKIENLPMLDAVIISHNHYDHLDKESILRLNAKTKKFILPIGVAPLLEKWGILAEKTIERNWWDVVQLNNNIEIIYTPAHHFSGRGIIDHNKTLWTSFVIKSKNHSIYFGGDSGFFNGYKEIGEKLGPFDITILPIGAYSKMWHSIHMNPSEAVKAHLDLKGKLFFPIHWGTFNLALHSWDEPAELLITEASNKNVSFVIPKPGEIVTKTEKKAVDRWWKISEENKISQDSN